MRKGFKFASVMLVLLVSFSVTSADNSVTISRIDGLDPDRGLMNDNLIRFFVNFEVGDNQVNEFSNGFKIYSPDDADWQPLYTMQTFMISMLFNGSVMYNFQGNDGIGADSLGWRAVNNSAMGFLPFFTNDVFYIQTGIGKEHIGKTLCLDTATFAGMDWVWSTTNNGDVSPAWDGPHCFPIVNCCDGTRGDLNADGSNPNIVDMLQLVNYLFRMKPAPACQDASDLNDDGIPHNMLDLVFFVNYLHRSGPAPGACP